MNVKWFRIAVLVAFSALLNSACADKDQFAKQTPGSGGGENKTTLKTAEQCKKEEKFLSLDQKKCIEKCPADQVANKQGEKWACLCPPNHKKDSTGTKCEKVTKQESNTSTQNKKTETDGKSEEETSITSSSDSSELLKITPVAADLSSPDILKVEDESEPSAADKLIDQVIAANAKNVEDDEIEEENKVDDLEERKKVLSEIIADSAEGELEIKRAEVKVNDKNDLTKSSDQVWDLELLVEYKKDEESEKKEIKEVIPHLSHESELLSVKEDEGEKMKLHATCLETSCETLVFVLEIEEQRKLVVADRKNSTGGSLQVYKDLEKKKRF